MRRFGITTFAVFYALLMISVAAERYNAWIVRQAAGLAQSSGQNTAVLRKFEKSDSHLSLIRIFECGFVVESPREGFAITDLSERHIPLSDCKYHAAWSGRPGSSRAPPSLV